MRMLERTSTMPRSLSNLSGQMCDTRSDIDLSIAQPALCHVTENGAEPSEDDLPPVDGGSQALSFLAAIFLFEAVIWGL